MESIPNEPEFEQEPEYIPHTHIPHKIKSFRFRIWDKNLECFLEDGGNMAIAADGTIWKLGIFGQPYTCEQHLFDIFYVLDRFTGFYDKNDNLIYEGDIIKLEPEEEQLWIYYKKLIPYWCIINQNTSIKIGPLCEIDKNKMEIISHYHKVK